MIPERTLHQIQERLDIVEVVGGYIPLKKAGRNFKALCPFHPEKTPSFMVYPQKQFFICYGCGAGGDLISFLMRQEHVEFPEAVRLLAQKAGVEVPLDSEAGSRANPELYRANDVAARYYHEKLMKSPEAEEGRAYLKRRGLEPATWEAFCLGYASRRWDNLVNDAKAEGFTPVLLERAGLAIPREGGQGWYDRFRHRVIFPIWDAKGRVIGFGGRVLEDAETPKYMNSPETELYVKGKILYGLHLAAPHIRERDFCIVVEGYMDLVGPYQQGIRNVVASMGTSLTQTQVRLIRRLTQHVVMVYDGDYAGEMATLRGLDLFLEAQMRVKVAALPPGTDPDALIREQGVQALIKRIQESQDLFDYKLALLKRRYNPKELEGRMRICEEMLPTIKGVPSLIQRGEYIKRLSELLGVEEALLWMELKRIKSGLAKWKPDSLGMPAPATMTAEELLVGLLLEEPRRVSLLEGRLEKEDLADLEVQRVVSWLMEQGQTEQLPSSYRTLVNRCPPGAGDWEGRLARWLGLADTVEEKERTLEDVLERIKRDRRQASLASLQAAIRQAEEAGDEAATVRFILEYNRLMRTNTAKQIEA